MTDAELTRLASKAFGNAPAGFSPLTDDGDALRLAVKLKLNVMQGDFSCEVNDEREICIGFLHQEVENNPGAATRRAIVRAAYEIGKAT